MPASSPKDSPADGVPRTLARLPASSMSSTAASNLWAAIAAMRSRRTDAVSRTAPAVIDALRLPATPGPDPVSPPGPGRLRRPAAPGHAGAERGHRRVALDRGDVVDVGAEGVGRQLDNSGLEAVSRGSAADVDVDPARRLDADRRRLGAVVAV